MSYHECLEGPAGCAGPVDMYAALSGSGERYPAQAPSWFDAAFAGERWSDDD